MKFLREENSTQLSNFSMEFSLPATLSNMNKSEKEIKNIKSKKQPSLLSSI